MGNFIRIMRVRPCTVVVGAYICAAVPNLTYAQNPQELEFNPPDIVEEPKVVDEITVVAPRSLVAIERQIEKADFALYEHGNSLIEDPLYKTYCRLDSKAGSNVKKRTCKSGFERELLSEAWESEQLTARQGNRSFTFDYRLSESELREHRAVMRKKYLELATNNPKLANLILTRARLQTEYNEARQRRHDKNQ